mmetsp:Transcript_14689/g.42295  ORF Transcript_14689/g.42295 Transcript_14689/m.42295 type:complete len:288 (-) Transcript_14689:123-986(-)
MTPEPHHRALPVQHLKGLVKGKLWHLHDFDVRATVGTGTFGRVRMVRIKGHQDKTPMALKILKKAEVIKHKQVEHVNSEKVILSMVEHPFLINSLTTFQDEKRLFMLMEFVNGGELFSYLRKDRTWTLCGTPEYLAPEMIQSKGHNKTVDWWALGVLTFEMLAGFPPFYDETPFGIYKKILSGKLDFPRYFDIKARDLIKRFLMQDPTKRIGAGSHGSEEVKKHKWFKGLDWELLLNRGIRPPFVPDVKSADDTSMFDRYPESTEASAPPVAPKDQVLFETFAAETS